MSKITEYMGKDGVKTDTGKRYPDTSSGEHRMRAKARESVTPELVEELTQDLTWDGLEEPIEEKAKFLAALSVVGTVAMAARVSGIRRERVYRNWQNDEAFVEHFEFARQQPANDLLEEEAWRRAVDGIERDVYHNGMKVDTVRQYSDPLLLALLKAHMPAKFGNKVEISASINDRAAPVIPTEIDRKTAVLELMGSLHREEVPVTITIQPEEKQVN